MSTPRSRRRAPRALVLVAVLALAIAGCSPDASDSAPGPVGAPAADLVPDTGAYLGLYYGDRGRDATDAAIGRTPQIALTYVGWEDAWTTADFLAEDVERGQLSLVNWEPFGADLHDVVDGRYDEMLTARGEEAGELAAPVLLDLAAEMNEEEGWGGHDPELYVAAYRHVHDLVSAAADGNVVWVWAPNNTDSAGSPGALEYYPGDEYVDWTGIDGYNWGTSEPGFTWQSFAEVFGPLYEQLAELGKPVIIGETASDEVGGSKPDWIADVVPTLQADFPAVRAVVWFDVDKERDWRVGSSPATQAAFRAMATDAYLAPPAP